MKLSLLQDHENFIKTQFAQPEIARQIWRKPLKYFLNENHVPFDCSPGEFIELQRKCYLELLRRLTIIPPRNHRAAGKAQVMLTCHLAEACHIPEAVAHRIIRNCYEWQGVDTLTKNPPIVDSTSFRVTKMRRMPSE